MSALQNKITALPTNHCQLQLRQLETHQACSQSTHPASWSPHRTSRSLLVSSNIMQSSPPLIVPSNKEIEANTLLERAEKKANAFTLFGLSGSKTANTEEASDMCARAGNLLKAEKKCQLTCRGGADFCCLGKEAGDAYVRSADYLIQINDRDEGANKYVEASKCYKKSNPEDALRVLKLAVEMLKERGRFHPAAGYMKQLAEIYEADLTDLPNSMKYYEEAADLYSGEDSGGFWFHPRTLNHSCSMAGQCWIKVATFAAQLELYQKAIEKFESVATTSMQQQLTRYSVKEYLLKVISFYSRNVYNRICCLILQNLPPFVFVQSFSAFQCVGRVVLKNNTRPATLFVVTFTLLSELLVMNFNSYRFTHIPCRQDFVTCAMYAADLFCHFLSQDAVNAKKSIERYQEMDPTFSQTRECQLLKVLECWRQAHLNAGSFWSIWCRKYWRFYKMCWGVWSYDEIRRLEDDHASTHQKNDCWRAEFDLIDFNVFSIELSVSCLYGECSSIVWRLIKYKHRLRIFYFYSVSFLHRSSMRQCLIPNQPSTVNPKWHDFFVQANCETAHCYGWCNNALPCTVVLYSHALVYFQALQWQRRQ